MPSLTHNGQQARRYNNQQAYQLPQNYANYPLSARLLSNHHFTHREDEEDEDASFEEEKILHMMQKQRDLFEKLAIQIRAQKGQEDRQENLRLQKKIDKLERAANEEDNLLHKDLKAFARKEASLI